MYPGSLNHWVVQGTGSLHLSCQFGHFCPFPSILVPSGYIYQKKQGNRGAYFRRPYICIRKNSAVTTVMQLEHNWNPQKNKKIILTPSLRPKKTTIIYELEPKCKSSRVSNRKLKRYTPNPPKVLLPCPFLSFFKEY